MGGVHHKITQIDTLWQLDIEAYSRKWIPSSKNFVWHRWLFRTLAATARVMLQ